MTPEKNIGTPRRGGKRIQGKTIVVPGLLLAIPLVYLVGFFGILNALQAVVGWPDILAYIWINVALGSMWWGLHDKTVTDSAKLQLAQSTMGTTIQAGIVASSIFIPLSINA